LAVTNTDKNREQQEIIELLPWHAAGNLSRRDAARVEEALARDPELARHLSLAREELEETVRLNESLGAPSPRVAQRLFAAIAQESPHARIAPLPSLKDRFLAFFGGLSPRTLAWSAGAAMLAILLQASVITTMLVGGHGGTFETATFGGKTETQGPIVLIRFVPGATAAQITEFLETFKASIIEGPTAGGMFRVRVSLAGGAKEQLAEIVRRMQESKIVGFVGESG
jgi:hypothetical protein